MPTATPGNYFKKIVSEPVSSESQMLSKTIWDNASFNQEPKNIHFGLQKKNQQRQKKKAFERKHLPKENDRS